MAIQSRPTGDVNFLEQAYFWKPYGSPTTVWLQEQEAHPTIKGQFRPRRMIKLLRWGNEIYAPIEEGMHLGIGVSNGDSFFRGYPTYIEAANIYSGGPSEPNRCYGNGMWELRPNESMVMDQIVNPNEQKGRPLIIITSGEGLAIGESTFGGTQVYRGQIRMYERTQVYNPPQRPRSTNDGFVTRGTGSRGAAQSHSGLESNRGEEQMRSYGGIPKNADPNAGRAAIGAGEETYLGHEETHISYNQDAQPVIFLRLEFRKDLKNLLDRKFGYNNWSWDFDVPMNDRWWAQQTTAGHIPVARPKPHQPKY